MSNSGFALLSMLSDRRLGSALKDRIISSLNTESPKSSYRKKQVRIALNTGLTAAERTAAIDNLVTRSRSVEDATS